MSRNDSMGAVFQRRCTVLATIAVLAAQAARAGPHALVPLAVPRFSIDGTSPSIGKMTAGGAITAGAVLDRNGPNVVISPAGLGLQPSDELDALSGNHAVAVPMGATFVILFGVDRSTVGARGPDPLLAPSRPFNVQDQANRHQAAADTFMTLDGWTRAGGPIPFGRVIAMRNNSLVINQGDTGGSDFNLTPDVPPELILPPGTPQDNGDGAYYGAPVVLRGILPPGLFFSVSKQSSVPPGIPVAPSGANIYVDYDITAADGERLFASAGQLGLQGGPNGDEIDGLMVFDSNDDGIFNAGDQIMFSLAPGSPSLDAARSPADIFMTNAPCFGPCCSCSPFARADDLGLLQSDNVDSLELLVTNDVSATVYNSSVYYVLPGDYDGDGVLTASDCGNFAACCTGPGVPAGPACLVYDMDGDGDVDGRDLMTFRMIFSQQAPGQSCLPLAIADYVNVLLSKAPGSLNCMADLNADGIANGKDIQLYVRMLLAP